MKFEGGCYCRKLRYAAEGEPLRKGQCHCRECQYISGGSPNMFMAMPLDGFRYTEGTPKQFTRSDIERPRTRDFCPDCGTHILSRRPGLPAVILKVGRSMNPLYSAARRWRSTRSTSSPFILSPKACRPSSACRRRLSAAERRQAAIAFFRFSSTLSRKPP
jgi:hypothetical protein